MQDFQRKCRIIPCTANIIEISATQKGFNMTSITFHDSYEISDSLIKFAVIAAKYNHKWIFCRHKERTTWELPGGHREKNENGSFCESIEAAARRELWEETGATDFTLEAISVYGVRKDTTLTFGMLFCAEVKTLDKIPPESEIAEITFDRVPPRNLTYPEIQPYLFEHARKYI